MSDRLRGLGCMRLSTEPKRDEARAIDTIAAALEAGVNLLDTADAYALDDHDLHHNEKLIAQAIARWGGPRAAITVVTKGGLTRPEGRWIPDGRAAHLVSSAEASAAALGGAPLDLYLLHAPDPKISFGASVRALASIREQGIARAVGLSNVTVDQLELASTLAPISAVEIKLSILDHGAIHGGVLAWCVEHGVRVLAHTPLGGSKAKQKLKRDPVLAAIAERHQVEPADIALAWLYQLHPLLTAIPGATRIETAHRAAQIVELTEQDRRELFERFGQKLPYEKPAPLPASTREVVIIMGIQGAGKSTVVGDFTARGYHRLNRDLSGGKLKDLLPSLEQLLAAEDAKVVLDNTYASRASRGAVVASARKMGASVRCLLLDTPIEEAQLNALHRMFDRYGRLLDPMEIRKLSKKDPNIFRPDAQFRYKREFEKPVLEEGFSTIENVAFERKPRGARSARGLLLELDGVLRTSKIGARAPIAPDDVALIEGRRERLLSAIDEGFILFGISWRPEVASRALDAEAIAAIDARTAELLALPIECVFCPHGAGPAICWCRKPLPGLGVALAEKHALDLRASIHVGHGPADRTFAARLGLEYFDAYEYFRGDTSKA